MNAAHLQAFATSAAVCIAVVLAFMLNLDDPWWAAISAFIVSGPEQKSALIKGFHRIAGTLAACILGYGVAINIEGDVFYQTLVIVCAFAAAVYTRFTTENAYAWAMFWIILLIVVLVSANEPSETATFAYLRSIEIVTGVSAAAAMSLAIEPWRPKERGHTVQSAGAPADKTAVAHVATFGAFSALVILFLWQLFDLPSIVQVFISLFVAMVPTIAMMRQQIELRLAGCLWGGVAGLAVAGMGIEILWLWLGFLFAGLYAAALVHHGGSRNAYAGTQFGIAFIIAMVTENGPPDAILPVLERAIGITLAYIVLAVLIVAVAPWVRGHRNTGEAEKTA
ncbi:MAG: FUSC family protein [Pseudomonadota bacterium]